MWPIPKKFEIEIRFSIAVSYIWWYDSPSCPFMCF